MLMITTKTPKQIRRELVTWFRQQRLTLNWTQQELSTRSGVALSTLRLFERSGQISLERLLRLASVLGLLESFAELVRPSMDHIPSISLLEKKERKRARK